MGKKDIIKLIATGLVGGILRPEGPRCSGLQWLSSMRVEV